MIHVYKSSISTFFCTSSFCLDLRSLWLFMLTRSWKRESGAWRTGIYVFFQVFPGKYAHIFCFKMQKVQNCQKRCNYAHVEENRSKSRNLSNEHLFVFFRGCRYISLFKIGQSSTFAKLSRRCLSIWFSPSFRPAFASWVLAFAGTTQFKPK